MRIKFQITKFSNEGWRNWHSSWIKDGRKGQPGKGPAWDRFVATRQGNKWNLLISDMQVSECCSPCPPSC